MDADEQAIFSSVIIKYRRRLDLTTYELEVSEAHSAQKDLRIEELEAQIESMRSPKGPQGPSGYDEHPRPVPKPGPPPTR